MTEIGHGLLAQPTGAPVAEVRPRRFSVHGQEITDPYAWLKAENWQEVLKDPAALPADIGAYLEAENAFAERRSPGPRRCAGGSSPRCAGASRRTRAPCRSRTGPSPTTRATATAGSTRSSAAAVDRARRARAGPDPDETILLDGDREGEGPPISTSPRPSTRADHAPARLERRHQGLRTLHDPGARPRDRPGPRRRVAATSGEVVWAATRRASTTSRWTTTTGRSGSAPPARHRAGGRRAGLRGGRCRLVRRHRRDPVGRFLA